jgi:4-alpha-glucanotransferase
MRRRSGILVPLFSVPSSRSWGIGEIGDIPVLAEWLRTAGQRILQILPINEMPPGERSPYSALSAMAIDPQFISLGQLEDFTAAGGEAQLNPEQRRRLDDARAARSIDYPAVRDLKQAALRQSFARFKGEEWTAGTARAKALRRYIEDQADWLAEYALFRALHARYDERSWLDWPDPLRQRAPDALAAARKELADDILYRQYVQWVAHEQWADAREQSDGVTLFGDLPFMVSGDSADVWARQDEFDLEASVGVPPDAFSETGQDWQLPVYRWEVFAERDFDWLRARARRNAVLFDGYRVDHLVGFYRTYFRPNSGGPPQFTPPDQEAQTQLGERVLQVFREPGTEIIAEDLGVVPDFVRASLAVAYGGSSIQGSDRLSRMRRRDLRYPRYGADGDLAGQRAARGAGGAPGHSVRPRPSGRRRRHRRRLDRIACRLGRRVADSAYSGRFWLAGSNQSAGDNRRRKLDLAPAMAG